MKIFNLIFLITVLTATLIQSYSDSQIYRCFSDDDCIKMHGIGVFCRKNKDALGSSCVLW